MEVEVWDEDYKNKFMTIQYHDVYIAGDLWLEGMNLISEWDTIKMDHASIKSDLVQNLDKVHANKRVTEYFNYAFKVIIPWANEFHPFGVTTIPIPEVIGDKVRIKNLKMAVRDDYFSFTCDPEFLYRHRRVGSSRQESEFNPREALN